MSKDTIHRIRPHKCACGSTWFREESFVELPKKHWEYDPEDSVNNAPNPIRLLVCVLAAAGEGAVLAGQRGPRRQW